MTEIALRTKLRGSGLRVRHLALGIRIVAAATIAGFALTTQGFLSTLSINALLTAISFVGCVAVGMTFITLTGNIMSLALGATVSATALTFLATLSFGIVPALLIALLFGVVITGFQGFLVGYFQANPILVSIAALSLLLGAAAFATGGHRIYPRRGSRDLQGAHRRHPCQGAVLLRHGDRRAIHPVMDPHRPTHGHGRQQWPRRHRSRH